MQEAALQARMEQLEKAKSDEKEEVIDIEPEEEQFDSEDEDTSAQTIEYTRNQMIDDLDRIKKTEDMFELIELTKRPNNQVRLKASQQMCPCRVGIDIPEFWQRLFEMSTDEDAKVRYQVMHNLCDGSPPQYEQDIMECIERFNRDPDNHIRRQASKVMASYLRTGKWNIL